MSGRKLHISQCLKVSNHFTETVLQNDFAGILHRQYCLISSDQHCISKAILLCILFLLPLKPHPTHSQRRHCAVLTQLLVFWLAAPKLTIDSVGEGLQTDKMMKAQKVFYIKKISEILF